MVGSSCSGICPLFPVSSPTTSLHAFYLFKKAWSGWLVLLGLDGLFISKYIRYKGTMYSKFYFPPCPGRDRLRLVRALVIETKDRRSGESWQSLSIIIELDSTSLPRKWMALVPKTWNCPKSWIWSASFNHEPAAMDSTKRASILIAALLAAWTWTACTAWMLKQILYYLLAPVRLRTRILRRSHFGPQDPKKRKQFPDLTPA